MTCTSRSRGKGGRGGREGARGGQGGGGSAVSTGGQRLRNAADQVRGAGGRSSRCRRQTAHSAVASTQPPSLSNAWPRGSCPLRLLAHVLHVIGHGPAHRPRIFFSALQTRMPGWKMSDGSRAFPCIHVIQPLVVHDGATLVGLCPDIHRNVRPCFVELRVQGPAPPPPDLAQRSSPAVPVSCPS